MTIDTFDIEFKRVFEGGPNIDFILNGRPVYGIRFRQLDSSFSTLIGWIKDYNRHRDKSSQPVRINEDGITLFICYHHVECGDSDGKYLGQFSIGDDWDGEAFSFLAPIETVMNTLFQRMRDYALDYPMDFNEHLFDDR